jgi:type I restriction enzyme R subunit
MSSGGTPNTARRWQDEPSEKAAQDELDALLLFKGDLGGFIRLYTFLSQIFDYGNTAVEKRAIFFKRLLPLLDFGRDRPGVDLSKVSLTHHALKDKGRQVMDLGRGDSTSLPPLEGIGAGQVREKQRTTLDDIIEHVNDLFTGELSDDDKLVYVNNVLLGKLLESAVLRQQATNNTKEQFGASPDLDSELTNAIMAALDAHTSMSTQALNSPDVRRGLKDVLLKYAGLYEALRGDR